VNDGTDVKNAVEMIIGKEKLEELYGRPNLEEADNLSAYDVAMKMEWEDGLATSEGLEVRRNSNNVFGLAIKRKKWQYVCKGVMNSLIRKLYPARQFH